MKSADIKVGEEYAIKVGDHRARARVLAVGRFKRVRDPNRLTWAMEPVAAGETGGDLRVKVVYERTDWRTEELLFPVQVDCLWAQWAPIQQARDEAAAAARAERERLDGLEPKVEAELVRLGAGRCDVWANRVSFTFDEFLALAARIPGK